jgi:Flp pilus assembly protein TadD
VAALILAAALIVGIVAYRFRSRAPTVLLHTAAYGTSGAGPTFVGAETCAHCHRDQFRMWSGSHHQLAMQPASDSAVLGNFNHVSFATAGITSTFLRRGRKFIVRTDGPDGAPREYEIKYTFGVYPLQQYLIAMPGGRLQAFGVAWDSRPRGLGGQRWFFLYPGKRITYRDPLHWTSINQNWNFMCADCHSTNVRKNYNPLTRTYATSYAEISVACEACHGPGSDHVAWAKQPADRSKYSNRGLTIALDERKDIRWLIDPATANPVRSAPRRSEREIQMCARCHARRSQINEDFVHGQPVGDDYRVALLEGHYFPDGQIKDEDYEYGSFIQSRMFHAGVTCGDCHEPHSLKLRVAGNGLCLQCHSASKYDSARHYFHPAQSAGARCVECHMPARTYMVVDSRRDHSLRIPRPDLTVKLGTPNACQNCHADKSAQWAADQVAKWYRHRPRGFQQFAQALNAGQVGAPRAGELLADLIADSSQPAIARASALSLIAGYSAPAIDTAMREGLSDPSPLVRRAAARAFGDRDPTGVAAIVGPLLSDPVRDVRLEAADALAGVSDDEVPAKYAGALRDAIGEYINAQELNADRPEAHINLGLLFTKEKRFAKAEAEYRNALQIDPAFAPAAVNLADLYRQLGREAESRTVLISALARSPQDASLHHALGLLMVRQGQKQAAISQLAEAARLAPDDARFVFAYAVALIDAGQANEALGLLEASLQRHPFDPDTLAAVSSLYAEAGKIPQAITYAQRLTEVEPDDANVKQLLMRLQQRANHHN